MPIDLLKQYRTKSGNEVRELSFVSNPKGSNYPIKGVMLDKGGNLTSEVWTADGKFFVDAGRVSGLDLVQVDSANTNDGWITVSEEKKPKPKPKSRLHFDEL